MIEQAIRIIRVILGNTISVTREQIEEGVNQVLQMPYFQNLDKEHLIREVQSIYAIRSEDYRIIEDPSERRLPWLNSRRDEITWSFWNRYRSFLQDEKGFAPDTISKLDRLTDRVLDGLFDPTANIQIDKRGMVVGQVQSGKTSNYTGLICKAVDAGFKLIIVLSGIHENLRSQTQLRLDEGFLGFDTRNTRAFNTSVVKIGVGNFGDDNCVAHSITSSEHRADFNANKFNSLGINFETNDPIVIVTKKHFGILENLERWLSLRTDPSGLINGKSALIIDDEADNASINTNKPDRDPTTINRRVRELLSCFRKSAYVGYTATPFANIFIPQEQDNLFPRDFIVNIPPPSNYIGPEKVFGFAMLQDDKEPDNVLPIINRIDDHSDFVPDRHKKNDQLPSELPDSLKMAIRCFVLTCAVRRLRGQTNVHNSMLVHVSRFQRWQDHITELVQSQFDYYRRGIDQNDNDIIDLFRSTFEEDQERYRSYPTVSNQILQSSLGNVDSNIEVHSWSEVMPHLNNAASLIKVRAIHGGSREALDYYDHKKDGLSVIAIGGNKLSRGLTLEGLTVSYYLRSSKMYDTLMQMGRWFGYRPGYVDLCRLFTSRELNEWYCHITHASEELREEFDYMADVAGSTPEQYALKVRTHPNSEIYISASNKLRSTINIVVSHSGRLVESYEFKKDTEIIDHNFAVTNHFFSSMPNDYLTKDNNLVWFDRPANEIISFLEQFQTLENLKAYDPKNLVRFIKRQLPNEELTHWRVALMSKRNASNSFQVHINSSKMPIGSWVRRQDDSNSDERIYYITKSHIISGEHELIDLTDEQKKKAMQLTIDNWKRNGEPNRPSGSVVRNEIRNPKNPLLMIYLLDPVESNTGLPNGTKPFVGYAISFPKSNFNANVEYKVNKEMVDKYGMSNSNDEYDED